MPEYTPGSDRGPGSGEELTTISYQAVRPGLPVVTHSGQQFGVVEHVLEVPDLDLFDGIVVRIGHSLRFVDADQIAAITPEHIRCTFGPAQVEHLPAPEGTPAFQVDMAREEQAQRHAWYGRMFRRPHWKPEGE